MSIWYSRSPISLMSQVLQVRLLVNTLPETYKTHITRKWTLRSLSLSYSKKDWWAGAPPIFFGYDNDKDLKVHFLVMCVNMLIHCDMFFSGEPQQQSAVLRLLTGMALLIKWCVKSLTVAQVVVQLVEYVSSWSRQSTLVQVRHSFYYIMCRVSGAREVGSAVSSLPEQAGQTNQHCKKFITNHVDLLTSKWCSAIDNMKSYVLKPQLI